MEEKPLPHIITRYGGPPCVLVVDDEPHNRMLLHRILTPRCQIVEAADGPQALAVLQNSDPVDLVLLDIMMPDMSGLEVLELIRSTPKTSDLPVILVSALADTANIVQGLQKGANDYVVKPFDVDVVSARVDTHVQLKRMMDVQKQAITELQAAQSMKDRLFRIASHDLKSPLSNVRMAETLLREFIPDDPTAVEILNTLHATVENMNTIIEEFLEVARVQSAGIEIHLEPVIVQDAVMQVVASYALAAANKNIQLQMGDLPGTIHADSARMAQVLSNLISNALKYSPQHTTITLWSERSGAVVRISIADQGPGIPANERQRLFTEFGRLSNLPTGNESSTGLGLWIVKHMVMLQNGTVGVNCPPEGGSIFWVEFPIEPVG